MDWKKLLCEKRQCNQSNKNNKKNNNDMRNEFQKDYHRIIGSASFRRLQDKTQVFLLIKVILSAQGLRIRSKLLRSQNLWGSRLFCTL